MSGCEPMRVYQCVCGRGCEGVPVSVGEGVPVRVCVCVCQGV